MDHVGPPLECHGVADYWMDSPAWHAICCSHWWSPLAKGHPQLPGAVPTLWGQELLLTVASGRSHRQVTQQTWEQTFLLSSNVILQGCLRLAATGILCVLPLRQLLGAWMANPARLQAPKTLLQRDHSGPAFLLPPWDWRHLP